MTDEEGNPLDGRLRQRGDSHPTGTGRAVATRAPTPTARYSVDGLLREDLPRRVLDRRASYAGEFYDDVQSIDDGTTSTSPQGRPSTASTRSSRLPPTSPGRSLIRTVSPSRSSASWPGVSIGAVWEDYAIGFAEPNDDGDYGVDSLIPGTYRLEFDAFTTPNGGHEFWDDQPSLELAQDIVVTDKGQVLEGYDAVLEEGQYPSAVENLTAPSISGSAVVGQTLTATPGTWNLAATTFRYQWWAGTTPVGADLPTYSPTAADVGKTITVTGVGSVAGLGSAAATSAPTAAVTGGAVPQQPTPPAALHVVNLKLPVIKGTLEVGRRARVTPGRWNPADVTLTYQWFVGGKRIVKADKRKVTLKEKWVGKRLKVVVVAKAGSYLATKVTTQRSSKIKP